MLNPQATFSSVNLYFTAAGHVVNGADMLFIN